MRTEAAGIAAREEEVISKDFCADQRKATTPSGTISYVERVDVPDRDMT